MSLKPTNASGEDELTGPAQLVEVGTFSHLAEANERALVILAAGHGYWISKQQGEFMISVDISAEPSAISELKQYENEKRLQEQQAAREEQLPGLLPFIYSWTLIISLLVQERAPEWWVTAGSLSVEAVLQRGEWWRVVTALFLHGDLLHMSSNLAAGLVFLIPLARLIGPGMTCLMFVVAGAAGNALNALAHHGTDHQSIGASTAVFAVLGALVTCQTQVRGRRWRRDILLRLGAGLALLGFLGTQGDNVDYMAHLCGFVAGIGLGFPGRWLSPRQRDCVWAGVAGSIVACGWTLAALQRP